MMTENDRAWLLGGDRRRRRRGCCPPPPGPAPQPAPTLTGAPVAPPSPLTVFRHGPQLGLVWAHSQTPSAVGAVLLDVAVVAALVWGLWLAARWFRNPSDLATLHQLRDLTPKHAAQHRHPAAHVPEGTKPEGGPRRPTAACCSATTCPARSSCAARDEDTYVAIMAPRAGKCTALAIPIAEEAPAAAADDLQQARRLRRHLGLPRPGRADLDAGHPGRRAGRARHVVGHDRRGRADRASRTPRQPLRQPGQQRSRRPVLGHGRLPTFWSATSVPRGWRAPPSAT